MLTVEKQTLVTMQACAEVSGKAVALGGHVYGRVERRRRQSNEKTNWRNEKEINSTEKVMAPQPRAASTDRGTTTMERFGIKRISMTT